jgi:hypothetical protein
MLISIRQAVLSSKQPGFYEEIELDMNIPKQELLDVINKTDDEGGICLRKQNRYVAYSLKDPKPLHDEEE